MILVPLGISLFDIVMGTCILFSLGIWYLLCNGCEESFFNVTKISFLLMLIIISVGLVDYIEQFARKWND